MEKGALHTFKNKNKMLIEKIYIFTNIAPKFFFCFFSFLRVK